MKFKILGRTMRGLSANYRGTYRVTPYYCEELGDDHKVNQLFFWYCDEGGEEGSVYDVEKALELIEAYEQLIPPQPFDLVEITRNGELSTTKSEFLGFDLSAGTYSLLSWGLDLFAFQSQGLPNDDKLKLIQSLLQLVQTYFQPKLNMYGLFSDHIVAKFCLDCMMALQLIRPGLWENEGVNFEVLGLWRVFPHYTTPIPTTSWAT